MIVELSDREMQIILFELKAGLETVNNAIAHDDLFVGEDEELMALIAKLGG